MSPFREGYVIYASDLYKKYGDKVVLDDIDLRIKEGSFVSLVGPSGCGKSTFFRLLLGEESPTSGILLLDGEPIGPPDTSRGIVYQNYSLYPNLTVLQNVVLCFNLRFSFWERTRRRKEFTAEAMQYLTEVGLSKDAYKYPHELSGGMRQRVAIVQALISKPRILLMDEPFGALDPGTRDSLQLFLLEVWEKYNMTILFVTHSINEALFLGNRIILLSQYYSDGRGINAPRGARIVVDRDLPETTSLTVQASPEFAELRRKIRHEGFDKEFLQHAKTFDLSSVHSFQTLSEEEEKDCPGANCTDVETL